MKLKRWLLTAAIVGAGVTWSCSPVWASNVPTGEYVFEGCWADSSEPINDEQVHASAESSGSSGSVSLTAHDDFYAGDGWDDIYRSASAYTYLEKTYRWETHNGAAPAPYSFTVHTSGSGSCTATNANQLQGSWYTNSQSGQVSPGDSSNASDSETYDSSQGYSYIGTSLYLGASSTLEMSAHQNSVSGSLSLTVSGSLDDPVY